MSDSAERGDDTAIVQSGIASLREPSAKYLVETKHPQTEPGSLPSDWRFKPLSAVITEMRGGAPLKPSDFTKDGVKVLPKGAVGRTGWLDVTEKDLQYCSHDYANAHRTNQIDEQYTVVVLRDLVPSGPSIGLIVRIRDAERWLLAQGVYGFKLNDELHPAYLSQLSNTQWYRKLMNQIMVGSTQVHITNTAFKTASIPMPPLAEQRAIATALSDVDALIAGLERLITKKRDIKQSAMQQLLTGQTRLPGFSGEWEVKSLGDVVDKMVGGGTPTRSNPAYWGNEIPWVTVKDFATFHPRQAQESITKIGLNNSASNLIPAGTLITSTRMALGKAVVYDVDVAINQDLKALFVRSSNSVDFLHYWFEHNAAKIDDLGSGSTVKGISLTELKRLPFPVMALPEQTAIATVLSDMDADLSAVESRLAKTRAIKQGMMQELLTGRTRLV
jgi:type I restriction enzyme S subunit